MVLYGFLQCTGGLLGFVVCFVVLRVTGVLCCLVRVTCVWVLVVYLVLLCAIGYLAWWVGC